MLIAALPLAGRAQARDFDSLYDKAAGPDYTKAHITGAMMKHEGSGGLDSFGIESIKMIICHKDPLGLLAQAMSIGAKEGYRLLVSIEEEGHCVSIFSRDYTGKDKGGKDLKSELLMISSGSPDTDNVIINIKGRIDVRNISKLSGMSYFKPLDKPADSSAD